MGKWEVIYDHGWHVVDVTDNSPGGHWHVVDVTDKSPGGQILICDCGIDPWSEMNARLIAAAPELAEALQRLLEAADESDGSCYGTISTSFVRRIAGEALAKAGAA